LGARARAGGVRIGGDVGGFGDVGRKRRFRLGSWRLGEELTGGASGPPVGEGRREEAGGYVDLEEGEPSWAGPREERREGGKGRENGPSPKTKRGF